MLAPCGRHANEVICPYPLACPCPRKEHGAINSHWRIDHKYNVENVNYTKEIGLFFDKACVGVGVKICYCKNDSIYFVYCLVVLLLLEVIKVALFVPTQMTGHNLQLWNVGMLFLFL